MSEFIDEKDLEKDQEDPESEDFREEIPEVPLNYDPTSDTLFKKKINIPYTTTAPSGVPQDRREYIYFDGADYFLYIYANGAWRRTAALVTI